MADLVFVRPDGQWFDFPPLEMAGMSGSRLVRPTKLDLIPLPEGATLTMMPLSAPTGVDKETDEFLEVEFNPDKKKDEAIYALAALLPQGFTRLLLPAAVETDQQLPLLGYTAVGVEKGKLVVAAQKTDDHNNWHPKNYNTPELAKLVTKRQKELPHNAIIEQLAFCALEYGCFTAQNIFYRRFEGGIPVSPICNADCIGCISLQSAECCPAPQQRIKQAPSVAEIVAVAIPHLQNAKNAIISFGQGCEGEPGLEYQRIAEAIGQIRAQTQRGIININTNAGNNTAIAALLAADIDSLRVSLFSPLAEEYAAYHRPQGYGLAEVQKSLRLAQQSGTAVALNLLAYPGFTDDERRFEALVELVRDTGIKQIQLRNLNIDPKLMQQFCQDSWGMGMRNFKRRLQEELPDLRIGNYSRDLRS
jgi:pyruvate-formate lyase-activating enzyme